jgi:hypothetical protein
VREKVKREYYGMAGVLVGQSDKQAANMRKKYHVEKTQAWMKGYDSGTMHIHILVTGLTMGSALMEEARITAKKYLELGYKSVRGGPWCRVHLPYDDLAEIDAVGKCKSADGVKSVARDYPGGSLDCHLSGKNYREAKPPSNCAVSSSSSTHHVASLANGGNSCLSGPGLASMTLSAASSCKVPLVHYPVKRPSGKPGKPGKSGVNGNRYRKQKGILYKGEGYDRHKLGKNPREAKRKHQATFRGKCKKRVLKRPSCKA